MDTGDGTGDAGCYDGNGWGEGHYRSHRDGYGDGDAYGSTRGTGHGDGQTGDGEGGASEGVFGNTICTDPVPGDLRQLVTNTIAFSHLWGA